MSSSFAGSTGALRSDTVIEIEMLEAVFPQISVGPAQVLSNFWPEQTSPVGWPSFDQTGSSSPHAETKVSFSLSGKSPHLTFELTGACATVGFMALVNLTFCLTVLDFSHWSSAFHVTMASYVGKMWKESHC